ncbi:MAG: malto-oligosyltrehalose trehalohydrolase [Syntrophorhabdaceae bacterium]|nr:malto-oligosyltrehalose trehalohydrolase [Syntrophorhabdaceae bacterium]
MRRLNDSGAGMRIGAFPAGDGSTTFRVWAPFARTVSVEIGTGSGSRRATLLPTRRGYFQGRMDAAGDGDLYRYIVDGDHRLPDPASRSQPEGVHGPSRIVDHSSFSWDDNGWRGLPIEEYIIYELHVGTFTYEGTFEAVAGCLDHFKELGVNAVELMPVSQFPGSRNWGYDGTFPFAPQNTYGGPSGLKGLVNACHDHGLAVILDVVYNHLGPEGNYLTRFGPYFTDRYRTPWGDAMNFDGALSDEVRHYFIENALEWFTDYHVDALRLDAIHGIFDLSARTFLQELVETVASAITGEPKAYLIAESDLNDIRVVTPRESGGIGFDAQWNDDFHHALHALLTGERRGYYLDFGTIGGMAKSFREGYVYTGQFSRYRGRTHGSPSRHRPARQFVVFSQNHDQVGNRPGGERLGSLVDPDRLRMAATAVLMSPTIPLLFMGEEYGETAPFQYFVSHGDDELIKAVRTGRTEEFAGFHSGAEVPDPQAEETFLRSKTDRGLRFKKPHDLIFAFYRHLCGLRRSLRMWEITDGWPAVEYQDDRAPVCVTMSLDSGDIACFFNFNERGASLASPLHEGSWLKIVDTLSPQWGGSGETAPARISARAGAQFSLGPLNAVVYRREQYMEHPRN